MVRVPCCEKMGLKKGPWSTEEDQILISHIHKHGHDNWRALPKQAGLLRCGKSCRLRWINYLRPDIKRGNFSEEEEETIIKLHEMLGNRWSAIATRLPGRTDNEIKNIWHTHLKKRLKSCQNTPNNNKGKPVTVPNCDYSNTESKPLTLIYSPTQPGIENPVSPQHSSSEISSVTEITELPNDMIIKDEQMEASKTFLQIDDSFWSEELSIEKSHFRGLHDELQFLLPFQAASDSLKFSEDSCPQIDSSTKENMEFWYNLLIRAGGQPPELPEF